MVQRYGSELHHNDGIPFVIASVLRTESWEKGNCFRSHDQEIIRIISRIRLVVPYSIGLDPSIIDRRCVIIVNFGKCAVALLTFIIDDPSPSWTSDDVACAI
jgi:hypothetical protein